MAHVLPPLPFDKKALEPHMSAETFDYHYEKHHRAYVDNLNKLVAGTEHEGTSLEKLIQKTTGPIFNNAAQIWNHTFFWNSLTPKTTGEPDGALASAINRDFGSLKGFQEKFTETATKHFGSGWAWLVKTADGKLEVLSTSDAKNPLTDGKTPLLTCDVWEHAYYIDYRNARAKYLEVFWKIANWKFAEENFAK